MLDKYFLTFFIYLSLLLFAGNAVAQESFRVAFWNVENLFDTYDDTCHNDDAFTPKGENRWTVSRYKKKLNNIAQSVVAMGVMDKGYYDAPALVGIAEVENDKVLQDLCNGTSLRRLGYSFVHYDSPDRRGIDNALLYRKECFTPFFSKAISVSDSADGFFTRDILLVSGIIPQGDTVIILVNHFPSKRGGEEADKRRRMVAQRLREIMDSIHVHHRCAAFIVLGDFNASPGEAEIRKVIVGSGVGTFVNLMDRNPVGEGSYKFQGHWDFIDQIIVPYSMLDDSDCCRLKVKGGKAFVFAPDFLLLEDKTNMGKKVNRTYLSMKYQGGYSDHLPVFIDIDISKSR